MNTATASQTSQGPEGRGALREGHRYPVRLIVDCVSSPSKTVHGVSKNLTNNGMRVRASGKILVGTRCRVMFLQAQGRVIPCEVKATVRNLARISSADREFDIGVEFDRPVQIKQPGKL